MEIDRMERMGNQIATVEEVQAMMRRRGYRVDDVYLESDDSYVGGVASANARQLNGLALFRVNYNTKLEIERWLDDIVGQHHMQHFCGFPLLREAKNTGSRETLAYRAVSDGPTGKSLLECPQCLQYVQDDSVEEIDDSEQR